PCYVKTTVFGPISLDRGVSRCLHSPHVPIAFALHAHPRGFHRAVPSDRRHPVAVRARLDSRDKHDGFRTLVLRTGARVRVLTRHGVDWTNRFPSIVEAARSAWLRPFAHSGAVRHAVSPRRFACRCLKRRTRSVLVWRGGIGVSWRVS